MSFNAYHNYVKLDVLKSNFIDYHETLTLGSM